MIRQEQDVDARTAEPSRHIREGIPALMIGRRQFTFSLIGAILGSASLPITLRAQVRPAGAVGGKRPRPKANPLNIANVPPEVDRVLKAWEQAT